MNKKLAVTLCFAIACVGGFAIAQTQNDLRRAAFQMSKESTAQGEFQDALEALQPLADSGDRVAIYLVGILYATGSKDLPQDHAKANAWFKKGADAGDAACTRQLAIAYDNGFGVPKDEAQAGRLLDRAANRGDAVAQNMLGIRYATGKGVQQDPVQAYKWMTLSSRGAFMDNEDARRAEVNKNRATLASSMSPTQVSTGEKAALTFSAQ